MIYGRDAFLHSKSHLCGVAITILSLDNSALLLYLSNIQVPDLQTGMVQNIHLELLIGCTFLEAGHIHILQRELRPNLL